MGREGGGPQIPEQMRGEELQEEVVKKQRGVVPRADVKTGSNESVDFNNPESVETYLNQIIKQKIAASGREIKDKTIDRWKTYFRKSVDRAQRSLEVRATEEGESISDIEKRDIKIEKIGSLKQHIDEALKRINPDLPNKEELKDIFVEKALKLKPDEKILIIAIDLDNFKIVNDQKGHSVGDKVLQSFGKELDNSAEESMLDYLQDATRPEDVMGCHSSGDEFLLLLVMSEDADDTDIVKRIIKSVRKNTNRPSLATGAKEGEKESQEISTGYEIIAYKDIKDAIDSPGALKKIFVDRLKEADLRSLYSKSKGNGEVESQDRIYGPKEAPEEGKENARQQSWLRILSEQYPEYAANSKNQLAQYAALTLKLPDIAGGDPGAFEAHVTQLKELMDQMKNKKK